MEIKEKIKVGFCITGSFCTFERAINEIENLCNKGYEVQVVMSEFSKKTDTRFGRAADITRKIREITNKEIIDSIEKAEPIGPKKMFDILIVAPCTGNTMGKFVSGIYDGCVLMAIKSHLRNERPVLIGLSTNDALGASAKSFGMLLNMKNMYFIPVRQDDPVNKPKSLVAAFELIEAAMEKALENKQIQPILLGS